MKAIVQPEFLFSYYYHAAKTASDEILKHKLPYSLYHALTSLVLWQCVLESYANFQIRIHGVENFEFTRSNGRSLRLGGEKREKASIKEKWLHLPTARNKPPFTPNRRAFKRFARLVELRNTFIHFKRDALVFEKEAPPAVTTESFMDWTRTGEFLWGSIYHAAIECGVDGETIVCEMFEEYSRLTGDRRPLRITQKKKREVI